MKTRSYSPRQCLFVGFSLLLSFTLLLAACGGPSTTEGQRTPTPGKTVTLTPSATATTIPMPPTQTSCPTAGRARGAVIAPLVLGSHANVVYVYNQGRGSTPHPIAGILKRYDITTRSEKVIVTMPDASIEGAQVSADGQWVLFSTQVSDRSAIQLVRMDAQGLQTLYCAARGEHVGALAWSPDQKYLAFQEGLNVYLLKVATGAYQLAVTFSLQVDYVLRTWLDNTHLYLTSYGATETPPLNLSLLDISTAKVQQVLTSTALCGDFDRSIDGTQLFTSECQFAMPTTGGPSRMLVQPATGGPATTIYSTPVYAITALRVASRTTLLFVIDNTGVSSIDTSHNGLWKVNTDGTGLTRLTSEAADEATVFTYTRTLWSTVSRDGMSYAVQVIKYANPSPGTVSLRIGSMSGGAPVAFATLTRNTGTIDTLDIVGWTTM